MPVETFCSACKIAKGIYKCPKCSLVTCSLACCKAHKSSNQCDGVKPGWSIVEDSDLRNYNESNLNEDFRFLQSAADKIHSDKGKTLLERRRFDKTKHILRDECRRRKVALRLMPPGLEKEKRNNSFYENFSHTVFWTVGVTFDMGSQSYSVVVDRIPETLTLKTLLKQFLVPRRGGGLMAGTDFDPKAVEKFSKLPLECLEALLEGPQNKFYKMDKDKPLGDNLSDCCIVEYPVLRVLEAEDLGKFQIVPKQGPWPAPQVQSNYNCNQGRQKHKNNWRQGGQKRWNAANNEWPTKNFDRPSEDSNFAPLPKLQRLTGPVENATARKSDQSSNAKVTQTKPKTVDYFRVFGEDFSDSELNDIDIEEDC